MFKVNDNFCKLPGSYLFSEVARRLAAYSKANPDKTIIKMGIGDVTRPICRASLEAMHRAVDDQSRRETFHGYGPEQGYEFLRTAIRDYDYRRLGLDIDIDEIFVGDGAKSDTGNIGDILSLTDKVAVTDPVYPVYVDTNVMAGRAGELGGNSCWNNIEYLPCSDKNGFVPSLPSDNVDVVYLCYPNNPTGTTLTRAQLQTWIDWALKNGALILFDSAYEAFISEPDVPHSIYEIPGARRCAIEFRSFSKTAGFTGLRCGYTVVPRDLTGLDSNNEPVSLNKLWNRRQTTKFNGASYIIQRAAEAIFTPEGRSEIEETIDYYRTNARLLLDGVRSIGLTAVGGINSPYVWFKAPDGMSSWEMFDLLLDKLQIAGTPGSGFGPAGQGFFRLTGFNTREATLEAVERLKTL